MSFSIYIYGFAIALFIFYCGNLLLHIFGITYGKIKLHKKPCLLPRESPLPSVSILKPLMGVDPNLSPNLETFFTMQYPSYELLFCIEDKEDPAVAVVNNLIDKYPKVNAHLYLGGSKVGVNPKINNLNAGYVHAKSDFVMISDSGIRMKEDTLLDMVQHMKDGIALVHQLPFTCDREGFAATFEKIYFGTYQARMYLTADLFGAICHTGMSSLIRRDVLEEVGGLQAFGCYLAEDFFLAKSISEAGWKSAVSSQPAWQNSGICDVTSFQLRLTRWAKLRVAMVHHLIILEPLSECMVLGCLASWAVNVLFQWDALPFYLVHILVWFLSDWIMLSVVQNGPLPFNKFNFVVGWLFREFTGPYLFACALFNPAIRWRERTFKLHWGGIAYETKSRIKS
ncbi:hypothetical protein ACKWTF_004719 [Chironomus riparius]